MLVESNFGRFVSDDFLVAYRHDQKKWVNVVKKIAEAEDEAFLGNPPSYSFICLRVALEELFGLVFKDSNERLFDKINRLAKDWPNCWVISGMHQIRIAGNEVAHSAVTNKSRKNLIILLEKAHDILRWYLEDFTQTLNFDGTDDFSASIYDVVASDGVSDDETNEIAAYIGEDNKKGRFFLEESKFSLTEKQKELSELLEGKHFVNAPPGTGKTHLLVNRLYNASKKYAPEDIVCLTFTNRAANEMNVRVKERIGDVDFFIGNVHAFCMDFLSTQASSDVQEQFRNLSLLDDEFKRVVEENVFISFFARDVGAGLTPQDIADEFHRLTGLTLSTEQAETIYLVKSSDKLSSELKVFFRKIDSELSISHHLFRKCKEGQLHTLAKTHWSSSLRRIKAHRSAVTLNGITDSDITTLLLAYLDLLKSTKERSQCYDFDDLISYGLIQVAKNDRKYLCIQVDECQDLNAFQWTLIDLLTADTSTVMAFGDLAQSIYSFMGAGNEVISSHTNSFERHNLETNHRSNENIVKFLNEYREKNLSGDYLPSMASKKASVGPSTLLLSYKDEDEEALATTYAVKKIISSPRRNVGILLRKNIDVDLYATHLNESGIKAFRLGRSDIMRHPCILDFLSFLSAYSGRGNRLDWYRLFYRLTLEGATKTTRNKAAKIVDSLFALGVSPASCLSESGEIVSNYAAKRFVSHYENKRIVIFDTETTSADVNRADLLQLAAVMMEDGVIVKKFNAFICVNPEMESDANFLEDLELSYKIHHIDTNILKEKGRDAHSVFGEFLDFLGDDETVLVAHNSPYDIAVLERSFDKLGSKDHLSRFLKKIHWNVFDTLAMSRALYPRLKSYKLESLLSEFNLAGVNSHDALDDVIATSSLVTKIASDLKRKIGDIDGIINENAAEFLSFNNSFNQLFSMINSQSINYYGERKIKNQLRISDILSQWVEYSSNKVTWYDEGYFKKLSAEIQLKLVPWIERHLSKGSLSDIISGSDVQKLSLMSESDLIDLDYDKVVVSTVHKAKGLQFETAIVPKVVDDSYPSYYSVKPNDDKASDEDARLLYVALSRPTDKLIVSYYLSFKGYSKRRSRFIENILESFDFTRCND